MLQPLLAASLALAPQSTLETFSQSGAKQTLNTLLERRAVALKDVARRSSALHAFARGTAVIGLGETTHGSGNVILTRGELSEHLIDQEGFDTVVLEAPEERCQRLSDFVAGQEIDPRSAIEDLFYWCWQNEEILSSVQRLKEWNVRQRQAGTPRRVVFTGMDIFPGGASKARVMGILSRRQPSLAAEISRRISTVQDLPIEERSAGSAKRAAALGALQRYVEDLPAKLKRTPATKTEIREAVQSGRNVAAYLRYATSGPIPQAVLRDQAMASNVLRLVKAGRRVLVWAHNGHVQNTADSLGGMLKKALGPKYMSVGSLVAKGECLTLNPANQMVVTTKLAEQPAGSLARIWQEVSESAALLDMRRQAIGEDGMRLLPDLPARLDVGFYTPPPDQQLGAYNYPARFDGLFFVAESIPSRPTRMWPRGVPMFD